MSIFYDEKQKLFQLDTKTTSYVIGIADGYAGHVYYGKKLESLEGLGALLRTGEAPFVPSENMREKCSFADTFPTEYSTWGVGDYRESSLRIRTAGGHIACELTYVNHEIFYVKKTLE